jgi:hypothetical protein
MTMRWRRKNVAGKETRSVVIVLVGTSLAV